MEIKAGGRVNSDAPNARSMGELRAMSRFSGVRYACVWLPHAVTLKQGFSEDRFFSFAEACGRFTPQIALRSPEAVFLEIGRSRHLYNDATLVERVRGLAKRFGLTVEVGIAHTAAIAFVAAKSPLLRERLESDCFEDRLWDGVPLNALVDLLDPFETTPETRRAQLHADVGTWIGVLQDLGVYSIGDFARLPREALISRFGSGARGMSGAVLEAQGRVFGERDAPWVGFKPEAKLIEKFDLRDLEVAEGMALGAAGAGSDLEALLFLLKPLMDRSMARLRGRELRASRVAVRLRLEGALEREWEVDLPFAQGTALALLPILRDRMDFELGRERLLAPVRSIEWEVLETTPGAAAQRNWVSDREDERRENWQALLGRLASRLGKARVFQWRLRDRHLPESAFERVPVRTPEVVREEARVAERRPLVRRPERPTRLLPSPVRLEVKHAPLSKFSNVRVIRPLRPDASPVGASAAHPRVLASLGWSSGAELYGGGQRFRVVSAEGPERLATEWWVPLSERPVSSGQGSTVRSTTAAARDYYRVTTQTGQQIWVFVMQGGEIDADEVNLHGFYD